MKILILKLAAIGDVLRTTSILKGLKDKYPGCTIDWVARKGSADILKNNKLIDNLFLLDKDLNNTDYGLVISLDDEDEACTIASEIKKKKLIGAYFEGDKKTYTEDSAHWFDMGLISKYGKEKADELKKLNKKTYQEIISGILGIKPSELILNLDKKELEFANKFSKKHNIKDNDFVIGLNTSAGERWQLKRLSIEKTTELAHKLNKELNAKIILFGGPEETERNQEIKEKVKTAIIDAGCHNTLMQFAALIDLCDFVVVSDSLAMNITIALKKKAIAFFGPTSAAEIELYGRGEKITAPLDCVCCYKRICDKHPNCMDLIKTEEIIESISQKSKIYENPKDFHDPKI